MQHWSSEHDPVCSPLVDINSKITIPQLLESRHKTTCVGFPRYNGHLLPVPPPPCPSAGEFKSSTASCGKNIISSLTRCSWLERSSARPHIIVYIMMPISITLRRTWPPRSRADSRDNASFTAASPRRSHIVSQSTPDRPQVDPASR